MNYKELILSANDRTIEPLTIPEWKGEFFVRSLTNEEYAKWLNQRIDRDAAHNMASFALVALCDADGKPVLSDSDLAILKNKSHKALDRIWDSAMPLNDWKAVEKKSAVPSVTITS